MNNFQTIALIGLIFLLVVGVLIFAGVLPGFRGQPGGEVGTVTVWGTVPQAAVASALETFNNQHKTEVQVNYVAKNPARYEEELIEALASLRGPDLFFLPHDWTRKQGDKVVAHRYEELPLADFKTAFLEEGNLFLSGSGALALPLYVDPLVLFYNKDMLASAGLTQPPTTWTRVKTDIAGLTRFDERHNILESAVALGQFENVAHAKDILAALLFQAGNPIVSVINNTPRVVLQSNFGFLSPPAIRVVDFFNQFSNPSAATYSWNRSLPEALNAFSAGHLAYYFGYASELSRLRQLNPHLNFDVALLPQKDEGPKITYGRLTGLAVSRQSRKLEGAKLAAKLLTGLGTPKSPGGGGTDFVKALSSNLGLPPARRDLLTARPVDPALDIFYRSAIIARGWLDPDPEATKTIFRNIIETTITGRTDTQTAVGEAAVELAAVLDPAS